MRMHIQWKCEFYSNGITESQQLQSAQQTVTILSIILSPLAAVMSMLLGIFPSKMVYFCLKTSMLAQYVFEQMKADEKYPPPIYLAVFSP